MSTLCARGPEEEEEELNGQSGRAVGGVEQAVAQSGAPSRRGRPRRRRRRRGKNALFLLCSPFEATFGFGFSPLLLFELGMDSGQDSAGRAQLSAGSGSAGSGFFGLKGADCGLG